MYKKLFKRKYDFAIEDIILYSTSPANNNGGFNPPDPKIGTWTDVYSLSATIYYCTTGKLLPVAIERIFGKEDSLIFNS